MGPGEWQQLQTKLRATRSGYLEVKLVDESPAPVYFDDLLLRISKERGLQEQHYDPWGLNLVGIESEPLDRLERRQYNGKEKISDFGLNWNDHGARFLSFEGRWLCVDPLAEQFPSESPYNFAHNNPIRFNDLDGRAPGEGGPPCTNCSGDAATQELRKAIDQTRQAAQLLVKQIEDAPGNLLQAVTQRVREIEAKTRGNGDSHEVTNGWGVSLTAKADPNKGGEDRSGNQAGRSGSGQEVDATRLLQMLGMAGSAAGASGGTGNLLQVVKTTADYAAAGVDVARGTNTWGVNRGGNTGATQSVTIYNPGVLDTSWVYSTSGSATKVVGPDSATRAVYSNKAGIPVKTVYTWKLPR